MKKMFFTALLSVMVLTISAQTYPPTDTPELEFALQLRVTLDQAFSIDNTQHGRRTVELEAIYCIRTDDGVYIHVRNRGIIFTGKDADGKPSFYFKAAPQFEAPADGKYAWLNNALFVCAPEWTQQFQGIVLNVWRVK